MSLINRGAAQVGKFMRAYPIDQVPIGQMVELPGRGRTYVTDSHSPDSGESAKPALFLLHSVVTTGQLCWYPSIPALVNDFRVITLDMRWHGRGIVSDAFSLTDCADDVAALADALNIERFAVAGFSMGGGIAQLVTHRHPDRVTAQVLCSTGPYFSGHPDAERQASRHERMLGDVMHRKHGNRPHQVQLNHAALDDLSVPVGVWGLRQWRSTPFSRYRTLGQGLEEFDSRAWLSEITAPTAVCVSTRDRSVAPSRQQLLVDGIPGAQRFDVDAGHACSVLQHTKFVPVFTRACRTVVPTAPAPNTIAAP